MHSQALGAQLVRLVLLLALALLALHHSPRLIASLSEQAVNAGCHQGGGSHHDHHDHHHHPEP
ncbi:hypothetical protein [Ferrimonas balearica]|uniref:hypothetical protein n=1 Tax=Ferrimonas balearica TaxID=44012 RepID=UPI001C98F229|nr:hypothetical protein [Ferrimonas balearica]MBY5992314.1 hypothetical protein [Ferrimonas balearica]